VRISRRATRPAYALAFLLCGIGSAAAAAYPAMAPIAQYRIANPSDEIALARSAAPVSISGDAEILTLGSRGYETAVKGKNGFVCVVERSWGADFDDAVFWNPKIRGPVCFNPASVRSVLPFYLEKTRWVLAGVSRPDMIARVRAELAAKTFVFPEPGAMCFMLSKQAYLSDTGGHWHPHLMFFAGNTDAAAWGANLAGSPVIAGTDTPDPVTTFLVPVTKWSDGTPAVMQMH
jgi:hypothetical protein